MTLSQLKSELRKAASAEKALGAARYFKTGKGEYGEGDIFLGVNVPEMRRIAKKYCAGKKDVPVQTTLLVVAELLRSKYHEERFTALVILVEQYKRSNETDRERIFDFYMENLSRINNWDLVDVSAPYIVGEYLGDKDHSVLFHLAKSENIWSRRVAVVATFAFIDQDRLEESLALAELLLVKDKDKHDLIHKAVGWMLREVGKRDQGVLEKFLGKCATQLPRTTLRYAIERFPEEKRKTYMSL